MVGEVSAAGDVVVVKEEVRASVEVEDNFVLGTCLSSGLHGDWKTTTQRRPVGRAAAAKRESIFNSMGVTKESKLSRNK